METLPRDQVNAYLLRKQHLTPGSRGQDLLPLVHDIVCLHGTTPSTAYLSLWARLVAFERQQLDDALYVQRTLTRITAMRQTLFLAPTAMLPVFYQAMAERLLRESNRMMARILRESGLAAPGEERRTLEELQQCVLGVLRERGPSTAAEIRARAPDLSRAFSFAQGRSYGGAFSIGSRLVPDMTTRGLLVRGRPRGTWRSNQYEYHLLQEWLPEVELQSITPAEAQAQLLHEYLRAFGPATEDDVAWWSGWSKAEVRRATAPWRDELVECRIEGQEGTYWLLHQQLDDLYGTAGIVDDVLLLPSLDPYAMAYRDRRRYLPLERHAQVYDRGGNAFATVWIGGQIAGVWQESDEGAIELYLWRDADEEALRETGAALGRFLQGREVAVTLHDYPHEMYVQNPFRLATR